MGIETYEGALHGEGSPKGERDFMAALVSSDETLLRRSRGFRFVGQQNEKLADAGVGFFVTNQRLLVIGPPKGLFKPKFNSWSFPYAELESTVATTSFEVVPGSKPYWVAGFAPHDGGAYQAIFFEENERDAFVADLRAALG